MQPSGGIYIQAGGFEGFLHSPRYFQDLLNSTLLMLFHYHTIVESISRNFLNSFSSPFPLVTRMPYDVSGTEMNYLVPTNPVVPGFRHVMSATAVGKKLLLLGFPFSICLCMRNSQ